MSMPGSNPGQIWFAVKVRLASVTVKLNEIQIEKVPHEKWLWLGQNKVEIATKNRDTL